MAGRIHSSIPARSKLNPARVIWQGLCLCQTFGGCVRLAAIFDRAMLEVLNLSHVLAKSHVSAGAVLEEISLSVPPGHLLGVIGAPGSGKSTLLRLIAGLEFPKMGEIRFQGHDTALKPIHPNSLGFVSAQDEDLMDALTVRETLMSAHLLQVAEQGNESRVDKVSHLLVGMGLETVASHRVGSISLAQRRRLKLSLALVSDAPLVFCDEFTAGLDVKSEQELSGLLKYAVADLPGRIIVHASQSLANLTSYDSVLILHEGRVCFHGPARAVAHYFSIANVEELYPRLAKRPAERWGTHGPGIVTNTMKHSNLGIWADPWRRRKRWNSSHLERNPSLGSLQSRTLHFRHHQPCHHSIRRRCTWFVDVGPYGGEHSGSGWSIWLFC